MSVAKHRSATLACAVVRSNPLDYEKARGTVFARTYLKIENRSSIGQQSCEFQGMGHDISKDS